MASVQPYAITPVNTRDTEADLGCVKGICFGQNWDQGGPEEHICLFCGTPTLYVDTKMSLCVHVHAPHLSK